MKSLNEKIKEAKEKYKTRYVIQIKIIEEEFSKQLDLLKECLIVSGLKDAIITFDPRSIYAIFKSPEEAHECYHTLLECDDITEDFLVNLI